MAHINRFLRQIVIFSLFLSIIASESFGQLPAAARAQQLKPGGPMRVVLLGTGIPLPNPDRAKQHRVRFRA